MPCMGGSSVACAPGLGPQTGKAGSTVAATPRGWAGLGQKNKVGLLRKRSARHLELSPCMHVHKCRCVHMCTACTRYVRCTARRHTHTSLHSRPLPTGHTYWCI